jgi:hypothetical protein
VRSRPPVVGLLAEEVDDLQVVLELDACRGQSPRGFEAPEHAEDAVVPATTPHGVGVGPGDDRAARAPTRPGADQVARAVGLDLEARLGHTSGQPDASRAVRVAEDPAGRARLVGLAARRELGDVGEHPLDVDAVPDGGVVATVGDYRSDHRTETTAQGSSRGRNNPAARPPARARQASWDPLRFPQLVRMVRPPDQVRAGPAVRIPQRLR